MQLGRLNIKEHHEGIWSFSWDAYALGMLALIVEDRCFCFGFQIKKFRIGFCAFDHGFDWARYAYITGWEAYWGTKSWENIKWIGSWYESEMYRDIAAVPQQRVRRKV